MKFDKKTISVNFNDCLSQRSQLFEIKERDDLLKRMGVGEKIENIPTMIQNKVENVINPYLIAKMHSEFGFPKELTLEEISRKFEINHKDYWSEWCEFWFESFIKMPHNILCDSEKYFEKMGWKKPTPKKGKGIKLSTVLN